MTTITKELTSDHVIGYGVEVTQNDIHIVFEFHPEIQKWMEHNRVVPEYIITEEVPGYNISISDYTVPRNGTFKIKEVNSYNSRFDIDELLSKIKISLPLTKHQYKFKFPIFRKKAKLNLTHEQKLDLVKDGIWSQKNLEMNQ